MDLYPIREAIRLYIVPAGVRHARGQPLLPNVQLLLRIIAGDDDLVETFANTLDRTPDIIRSAAEFYV